MIDDDVLNSVPREKRSVRFGLVESFILILILYMAADLISDYEETVSTARKNTEQLFLQASRNVQVELGRVNDAVAVILNSAKAYRNANILDTTNAWSTNALFISYLRQYPFITSINIGDPSGNGYLLFRNGEQLSNRINKTGEKGVVTWLTLGERGEVVATQKRQDDYDPRNRPWYRNTLSRGEIAWSDPYVLRTTRDAGISASMRIDAGTGGSEVVGVDIMLKDMSRLLAAMASEPRGMSAHLISRDGMVIASSELGEFLSRLQKDTSSLPKIGTGRYPFLDEALGKRTKERTLWSFTRGNKRFLASIAPVTFTPGGKYNLVLTVPEEAIGGDFVRDALRKLIIGFLLVTAVAAWYFFRYLLPLRRIAAAIREFGAGKCRMLQIDTARSDEIGVLASEFNKMSDDRMRIEESLRQQKKFTENLLENCATATFVIDPQHKVVLWNRACEELTGIAAATVTGTNDQWRAFYDHKRPCLSDLVLDGDLEILSEHYATYATSNLVPNGLHAEGWYQNLNGKDRYITFEAAPVHDSKGNLVAAIESIQDITMLKRADEAKQEAAERLNVILDGINALIYVADLESHEILFVNKYGRDIWGEVVGKTCWDTLQSGQNGPCAFCTNGYLLSPHGAPTGMYAWEFRNTITGGWYDCRDQAIRWSDGRLVRLEIATDITDRKKAEEELRLQSAALKAAANAIVITDRSGSIVWVNPAFTMLTGYSAEESMGVNPRKLVKSGVHGQVFYQQLWDVLLAGEVWRGEIMNRHKNGIQYPEGMTITPVKDARGEITNFIAIKRDLTEQRKLEEQLRQSQRMESIGTLAGGVAHDFNNILTAIIGYGYLALKNAAQDDPQRRLIEHILKAADRAAHLTKELLLFSRKQAIDSKQLDLNAVVTKMEIFLKRVIGEDIAFKTVLQEIKLTVMADVYQLEQVLMNLATNARDAMPQGGTLTLTTEAVQLDQSFTESHGFGKPGQYALLTVSDTGEGMDEETRQRIFEPFFTTKDVGKGTGLGLAAVYGIICRHEGFINVYSEPGCGTTFQIYLPVIHQKAGEETVAERQEASFGGAETILLAEDDESVRCLTRTILTDLGYTVIEAVDGEDAVRKFAANKDAIDLLLFDLVMPKMNGNAAYDEIRIIRPEVKAILTSGYAPDIIRQRVGAGNGVTILSKPAPPAELLRRVRQVLDEKR
jgi:PAS domain S-box-containing protein